MYEILEINQNYCYIKEQNDGSLNEKLNSDRRVETEISNGKWKKIDFQRFQNVVNHIHWS